MSARCGTDWAGEIQGNVPVQGFGTVNLHPWYFRARGVTWTLSISAKEAWSENSDPIAVWAGDADGWHIELDYCGPGGEYAAGWMAEYEAWDLIAPLLEAFAAGDRSAFVRVEGRGA